ncbi:hypothetical protein Ahy_B08g094239 [Arachis hypogaea]|uniref:ATP synthase subunit gamma n=1 Tax=Arachis hypogaea TaxID=3818 RepID=A0A444Y8A5_ARAHY|nr:hypothetical protein Ahy_B08g094239 [Arachis hypogaea]
MSSSAGGFNNTVLKKAETRIEQLHKLGLNCVVISVEKKGNAFFSRKGSVRVDRFAAPPVMEFEQNPVQILDAMLPLYLNSHILRGLQESLTSELAARMAATSNVVGLD